MSSQQQSGSRGPEEEDLEAIQRELEELNDRRKQLESKRQSLVTKSEQVLSSGRGSQRRAASASRLSVMTCDHGSYIASEKEKRQSLAHNNYYEMKEAMKASWDHDSTLVGGFFNIKDNPHNSTFGRARRFQPVIGMKGNYYLSTDTAAMQEAARNRQRKLYSVANRGKVGCNVNSHWNDSKGGCAPGPGAYTPRYQKVAPPVNKY